MNRIMLKYCSYIRGSCTNARPCPRGVHCSAKNVPKHQRSANPISSPSNSCPGTKSAASSICSSRSASSTSLTARRGGDPGPARRRARSRSCRSVGACEEEADLALDLRGNGSRLTSDGAARLATFGNEYVRTVCGSTVGSGRCGTAGGSGGSRRMKKTSPGPRSWTCDRSSTATTLVTERFPLLGGAARDSGAGGGEGEGEGNGDGDEDGSTKEVSLIGSAMLCLRRFDGEGSLGAGATCALRVLAAEDGGDEE
jgi:hypothetical protein